MRYARVNRPGAIAVLILISLACSFDADAQDEVALTGGDLLSGRIVEQTEERVVLEHAVLGTLSIPRETIEEIRRGEREDETAAPEVDAQADVPAPEREWRFRLDFGGNATFGNTDTQGFFGKFLAEREDEDDRTVFDAAYFYGSTDGDRTTNKFTTGLRQDWFVTSTPWFFFAQGRYDYDEFNSWEHRIAGHGGVGYKLIDTETFDLSTRAGLGVIREFESPNEDFRLEGLLGLDLSWVISPRQRLTASTTLYPDLSDVPEFRWLTSADWAFLIDDSLNMNLTIGVRNEYQSKVDTGRKHNDIHLFAGLGLEF